MSKQTDSKKKLVDEKAVEYIKDGMTIGLGSGSTVYWTLKRLENGMNIRGIPSSRKCILETYQNLHITLDAVFSVDL